MNWEFLLRNMSLTLQGSQHLLTEFQNLELGWLGYDPADQRNIEEAEDRLGTSLPPSYKDFLKVSNGFRQINCFVWNILPIQEVQWLKHFDPEFHELHESFIGGMNVSDDDYFVYGDKQKSYLFREEYLAKSLAISDWGDSSILLLNPEVKFGAEWEAWRFSNWGPGPDRYRSFSAMMQGEYSLFLKILNHQL